MTEFLQSMNLALVDVIAIAFIVLSGVHGLFRKLSGELAHVLGFLAAWFGGRWAFASTGRWLGENSQRDERMAAALAFLCAVFVALLLMILLRWVLRRVMTVVFEPHVDRIGGLFAGLFRGTLIVGLVFFAMNAIPYPPVNTIFGAESRFGRNVLAYSPDLKVFFEEHFSAASEAEEVPGTVPPPGDEQDVAGADEPEEGS